MFCSESLIVIDDRGCLKQHTDVLFGWSFTLKFSQLI